MLPNWLYGKSKSKLASILGGGGGTPADYDQVKAQVNQNAEDIITLSNSLDDKAAKTQIANPNILHNPWFAVNQRGATSVTVTNGFIADRWRVWSAATFKATRNSNGYIAVDNISGESTVVIYQKRTSTYLNSLVGKKLTASVMLEDGTIHNGTITYNGAVNEIYFDNDAIQLYTPTASTNQILGLTVKSGASITVKALKLEVGEISTLHLDPRPEYATELAKCRRYFYKTLQFDDNGASISPNQCLAVSTTRLQGIKFPAEMRVNPTITINKVNEFGSSTAITGVNSQWTTKEGISYFTITGATVGSLYIVDFEASAEL